MRLVADENGRFGHPLLREASVLALSKFMCISEAFCDRNLSLLFTTLERSKDTAVSRLGVAWLGLVWFARGEGMICECLCPAIVMAHEYNDTAV